MKATTRHLAAALVACASAGAPWPASAAWPERPIRVIIPQPPGGNMDANMRALSDPLVRALGQNIVVDNRSGANGIIAGELLAKAAADGYTLFYTSNSFVNNQVVRKRLPFDVTRDFVPLSLVATLPGYLIFVNPQVPAKNVRELIALSKRTQVAYGSGGVGNSQHLLGEFFNMRAGAKLVHVPYKGFAPILNAVIGNEIQLAFGAPTVVVPQIKANRVRALAYTGKARWSGMPELPTVAESGVQGFDFDSAWHGMFAPAGVPADVLARLNREIGSALRTPLLKRHLETGGYVPVGSDSAAFRAFLANYLKTVADIARQAGIQAK